MNLKNIFSELTTALDEMEKDREEILKLSRSVVRDSGIAIKHVHRKEFDQYSQKIEEIKINHTKLLEVVNKNPGVYFKFLKTPEQEYTEAIAFYSIVQKKPIPTPNEINIDPLNFAFGLSDVVGELRRYALDNIRNSRVDDLNEILESMDEIYNQLFSLDYPGGITQDLRRKTDVCRTIIERTRGDISITIQMTELRKCMEDDS